LTLFKNMPVPLNLVVKHGASFEVQARKAIKKVYDQGRDYRKHVNPVMMLNAKFSHAMVVKGFLGKIPCTRLVIDPGNSISMIDVNTARKGPIPITKDSDLSFQL